MIKQKNSKIYIYKQKRLKKILNNYEFNKGLIPI